MALRAAALASLLACAHAGVGGSTLSLAACAPSPFQSWNYTGGKLRLTGDAAPLWQSAWCMATNNGINHLPTAAGTGLYASPCGSAFPVTLAPPAIALADGSGLCVALAPGAPALPGAMLALAPCAAGAAAQAFSLAAGALTHAPSGLCVDAGARFKACEPGSLGAGLPFCDAGAPLDARVADLVGRLSFEEKAFMLSTASGGAPRAGVSPQQWWQEALHGIANNVGVSFNGATPASTSFPQPITSSCSFNRSLWRATGEAISMEVRAFANAGHAGLTMWSPNINIARDPRWGRIQETPGEDPFLSGAYAENYVRGMQEGEDARYLKTSACCKHFAAYSLENWHGMDRYHFNAVVTDEDLVDTYLPAFQQCVEGGRASSIMCSYNAVNGVPSCANSFLLTDVARGQWSFDGYITSDCGAVTNIPEQHNYTPSVSATFAATLGAGMDIGCDMMLVAPGAAAAAVSSGAIATSAIDAAVARLLRVRYRTGEFDPAADQPYTKIGTDAICSPAHVALARESARQGIVLLTNPGRLPLSRSATRSVAVIGPLGNSSRAINGGINYADVPCGGAATTLVEALAAAGVATTFTAGCADVACASTAGFSAATAAAAAADAALVVVGLDETIEDEALDRVALTLPGAQAALIAAACGAARVCAVVVMSGGAVDLGADVEAAVTGGVFIAGFLGGSGAPALVDTLFGASSPAGRLSQTIYAASFIDDVSMMDMNMRPGPSSFPPGTTPGRTHRFYTGTPRHAFGEGLSYTTWAVAVDGPARVSLAPAAALVRARAALGARFAPRGEDAAAYRVNVTNTGSRDSDYVVLGFLEPPGAGANGVPLQELFGFERVFVPAGQTVSVWLGVGARDLTRVAGGARAPAPGAYRVRIGPRGAPRDEAAALDFVAA